MTNEIDVVKPKIAVKDFDADTYTYADDLDVLKISNRIGPTPTKVDIKWNKKEATFSETPTTADVHGPITILNTPPTITDQPYQHRSRITIYNDDIDKIWFNGFLTKKTDQHAVQRVLWEAVDDRILLRDIYINGCFIADFDATGTRTLKFSSAMDCVFNPKGSWNCVGFPLTIGGQEIIVPVFSNVAVFNKAYESPNLNYNGSAPVDGTVEPWTPRRILQYITFVMHYKEILSNSGINPLLGESPVSTSLSTDYLYIDYGKLIAPSDYENPGDQLIGTDNAITTFDPLDRKSTELTIHGDSIWGALVKTLKTTDTHELCHLYKTPFFIGENGEPDEVKTELIFKPKGYQNKESSKWKTLKIQYEGIADTTYGTVIDFALSESTEELNNRVFVEGETEKVEVSLEYDQTDSSTIVPAWTQSQQDAFLRCIKGNFDLSSTAGMASYNGVENSKWALVPKISGKKEYTLESDFQVADGTNGAPLVRCMTDEAVSMAQKFFPMVFSAFKVVTKGDLLTALEGKPDPNTGVWTKYTDAILHSRPILPEQLQFLTNTTENNFDRLRVNLPVRMRINSFWSTPGNETVNTNDEYYDVSRSIAIRISTDLQGNNLIWLDGVGITADKTYECIYNNSITNYKEFENIKVNKFKLNCAVPKDTRVYGTSYIDINRIITDIDSSADLVISPDYEDFFEGTGPYKYIDRPNSFRSYQQYKSFPASNVKYFGGTDGTEERTTENGGLTGFVPPGDEAEHAEYAAERHLLFSRRIKRNSTWIMTGINTDFEAGDWLGKVLIYKYNSEKTALEATQYIIDSQIGAVEYDFLEQKTKLGSVVGGFINNLGNYGGTF